MSVSEDRDRKTTYPDEVDIQIIEALRSDPQITNKAIARSTGVSETTVAQRIRAMSQASIMRVVAQRDVYSDGYQVMCFAEVTVSGDVDKAGGALSNSQNVISVARAMGVPQILTTVRAKSREHLREILLRELGRAPGVASVTTQICMKVVKLETGYGDLTSRPPPEMIQLDDKQDEKIALLLVRDGRISNREIARRLDMSEGAVRQRIRKMNEAKEMRLGVVCDPVRLNRSALAIVRLATRPAGRVGVIKALESRSDTSFIGETTGDYDLWLVVQAGSTREINQFCDFGLALEGVHCVSASLLVRNYIHRYDLVRIR